MFRAYITSAEEKKLAVFQLICNANGVTLAGLSDALNIPVKTVQKYIYSLNEDLPLSHLSIHIAKNDYHQYVLYSESKETDSFYTRLCSYYLNQSLQFRLIRYLIRSTDLSIPKISTALCISQSHIYRLIHKINCYLVNFRISLKSNTENQLSFQGSELDIRVFIYSFITQCLTDTDFELPRIDSKHEQSFIRFFDQNLDPFLRKKLVAFWQTIVIRTNRKNFLPVIPEQFQKLLNFYAFLPEDITQTLFIPTTLKKEIFQSEWLYLNFFYKCF